MIVHCLIKLNDEVAPVELFTDVRSAIARYEELQSEGVEGLSIFATDL